MRAAPSGYSQSRSHADKGIGTLPGTNEREFWEYVQQFPHRGERKLYEAGYGELIRSILTNDGGGIYFVFVLTDSDPVRRRAMQQLPRALVNPKGPLIQRLQQAAFDASRQCFPELSRSNTWRHDKEKAFGVLALPAISASGLLHCHGLVRVPIQALRVGDRPYPITIQQNNRLVTIEGPYALQVFVAKLRALFPPQRGRSTSLCIVSEQAPGSERAEAANHKKHPQVIARHLAYLQDIRSSEVRSRTELAAVPQSLFRRIRNPEWKWTPRARAGKMSGR